MNRTPRNSRNFKLFLLLFCLIFFVSQNKSLAAAADEPRIGNYSPPGPTGWIDLTIWAEGFGYDGANWIQMNTFPYTHTTFTKDGLGLDDIYTYESVHSVVANGLGWVDCGWGVNYEITAFITPPPECKLSISMNELWLPGMCWGCLAGFCDVESYPAAKIYEDLRSEFIIGQDILKVFPVTAPNFEGSINILVNHATEWGTKCDHHAFLP